MGDYSDPEPPALIFVYCNLRLGQFKKGFFSKENRKFMDYSQRMEGKYGKDWNKILDQMTDREYKSYSKLLANNPVYNKRKKSNTHQTAVEISGKSAILSLGNYADFESYLTNEYGINVHLSEVDGRIFSGRDLSEKIS